MTTVLNNSMSAKEIQERILQATKEQEKYQNEMLNNLRTKRQRIKKAFEKEPLKLDKSPLELQREWRNE